MLSKYKELIKQLETMEYRTHLYRDRGNIWKIFKKQSAGCMITSSPISYIDVKLHVKKEFAHLHMDDYWDTCFKIHDDLIRFEKQKRILFCGFCGNRCIYHDPYEYTYTESLSNYTCHKCYKQFSEGKARGDNPIKVHDKEVKVYGGSCKHV